MILHDADKELIAHRLAHTLSKNWVYVDVAMKTYLKVVLSKRDAITVAKRALELMEEEHL